MALPTPRRLSGRYELGEILGVGGMSEVYVARDLRLHRDVAVKLLRIDLATDPSLNLRFQREARHVAALNHPAIAAIYDTGEVETPGGMLPFLVMEYVDGLTLRDIVSTQGPMEPGRAIEVIAEVCGALTSSHQRGLIHRDVKPANIMIGTAGSVKVVDFGIAMAIADGLDRVTQTGAVIGTAHYLSPEQARGDRVDARTDVYSLGCVLYETLTGRPPFVGDSPVSVAYQHVRKEPVAPSRHNSEITSDLDAVVLRAMAKNPDNRYQTAEEMRADLTRVHGVLTPNASTDGRADVSSTRRWLTVVAALAVLTVAAVVGMNVVGSRTPTATVPNVDGQASADAVKALLDGGFTIRTRQSANATVPAGHVIGTDPDVNASVGRGEEVILYVSTGPSGAAEAGSTLGTVPDVSSLTYADAVRTLTNVGFGRFQQASLPSPMELKDRVVGTNPPANQTTPMTSEITIVMGSGPAVP